MSSKQTTISTGQKSFVRTHLNEIQDMIDIPEPWTIHDLPFDGHWSRAIAQEYQHAMVIEKVGRNSDAAKGTYTHDYRFLDRARDYAEECLEDRAELPCGHSAHVHHRDGKYGCKHCDEPRDYSRETIEEAL